MPARTDTRLISIRLIRSDNLLALPRRSVQLASRRLLLASASALCMLYLPEMAVARSLNGGGSAGVVSAPNVASDAAAQAAQRAASAARQTQESLARSARAVQDMQAVQSAARPAAAVRQTSMTAPASVPNGLGAGGLLPNMPQNWIGANKPTDSEDASGRTQVRIEQTTQKAILDWQSFNVGARTTLTFDQRGNANWVALNRVNAQTGPSQILGNIKADGHVYVINQSGIIFGGNSQINVGALIASTAKITNEQFLTSGVYSTKIDTTYTPSFTEAQGKIVVESGALITTPAPKSVTSGGGFVLLLGKEVVNSGTITTPKGQAALAAGDDFILRKGVGTDGNLFSTTRGSEIAPVFTTGTSGVVTNNGLMFAQQGDVTLAGLKVRQDGVLLSTTSVNQRGTIHLLTSAQNASSSVTLTGRSISAILPELESADTALDAQRDALIAASVVQNAARADATEPQFDHLSKLADRQDQSRIEIVTGGMVDFQNNSLALAQGGQVAVSAGQRVFAEKGSTIDVSGVQGALRPMSANQVLVNVQGNELRDSPENRDSGALINKSVWIDIRDLVLVPAGTGGYAGNRYYTKGGLLEVGGYLSNTAHSIGEWTALGGTITLAAPEVVAQQGAKLDISGGSVSYEGGRIYSSKLIGSDGRIYSFDNAPADMKFLGSAGGFVRTHNIQGQVSSALTEIWTTVFDRSASWRYEAGYSVGRDAGRLELSTPTAMFEADILAHVITGERQNSARTAAVADGYKQVQNAAPLAGTLGLGEYAGIGLIDLFETDIRIGKFADASAPQNASEAIVADRSRTAWFDAGRLSGYGLGRLELGTRSAILMDGDLTLAYGGALDMSAAVIDIKAGVTARGGSVTLANSSQAKNAPPILLLDGASALTLHGGARLDLRGVSANGTMDVAVANRSLAYLNGGSVQLQSSGDVVLKEGSEVDVSSGVAILRNGKMQGGRGGNVTLLASTSSTDGPGDLVLAGGIRGYGIDGGGTLTVQARHVTIGSAPQTESVRLDQGFFEKGFSAYNITGNRGVVVSDGAAIDVIMPVFQPSADALALADPAAGLQIWMPPLYQENPRSGVLTQRKGASLALRAGSAFAVATDIPLVGLRIGKNAVINVDTGQSIALQSIGQLTVDGRLHAPSGRIELRAGAISGSATADPTPDGRSFWIGDEAVLDVAARAAVATDLRGRRYGQVANGGSIIIGGQIDHATGSANGALFVVIRDGAVLDASGAQAMLDISGRGETLVASNGGDIAIGSTRGLYLDGVMRAAAGGTGAAGGTLSLGMGTTAGNPLAPNDRANRMRELILTQVKSGNSLGGFGTPEEAADALVYGYGLLGLNQITAGGFDNLALSVQGQISFDGDVTLNVRQSLQIYAASMALSETAAANARISLASSYVRLAGVPELSSDGQNSGILVARGTSTRPSDATLTLQGDLLDVRDLVGFGANGPLVQTTGDIIYDRRGFVEVHLESRGDLRLLKSTGIQVNSILTAPERLRLTAAQIYPVTNASAIIRAKHIVTGRSTAADPAVPYSVFGRLNLEATVIDHGGVLRAPLGELTIGLATQPSTSYVNLLPGSVTSVSAAGLMMPYGGTVDGVTYTYNKASLSLDDGLLGRTPRPGQVFIAGQSINVANGAVIDLTGGGELMGAGFISGRGGSVDTLLHPLVLANPGYRFSASGNSVYAILPGSVATYAPVAPEAGAGAPAIGRQITLDGSIPGLPAGTYTLLPSTYALLPGAFRVEIAGAADPRGAANTAPLSNGSWLVGAQLGIANTGIRDSLHRQAIVTPGQNVRKYSLYNEMGFSAFVMADAARLGIPRARLPSDTRGLMLQFGLNITGAPSFSFDGQLLNAPAAGGWGGDVTILPAGGGSVEIVQPGQEPTPGFGDAGRANVTLTDRDLNALNAGRLIIGGRLLTTYGQGGNFVTTAGANSALNVAVRSGARLTAEEVFLISGRTDGGILVEQGASIDTLGKGMRGADSRDGFVYAPGQNSMLAVSNGYITMLPPESEPAGSSFGAGTIDVGGCASVCSGVTSLYSEGTIVIATDKQFSLSDSARYGTRNLTLAVGGVNVGTDASLAAAAANGILGPGLILSQSVLDRLLRGDTSTGAPALETLSLTARDAFNFFGTVTLDTINPATGRSRLSNLVLTSPAMYGQGSSGDVATIRTGHLIWNGSVKPPAAVITGGAGTGSGMLAIDAAQIEFGYGPNTQIGPSEVTERLALGFAQVNLNASERVTANHKGGLSVYQSQGAYVAGAGFSYSGGNLNIATPVLTGKSGSVNRFTAGGALRVTGAGGTFAATADLGGELSLRGNSLLIDSSIVLPSGKLTLAATNDITLSAMSRIDVAGREVAFSDVTKFSWGGDVILVSDAGNIRQEAGSIVDLSARNNHAGNFSATALQAGAGVIDLAGSIEGSTSGYYDAGGTVVPYRAATANIRAQRLGASGTLTAEFAALNARLNAGHVFGGRSFQLKQGDLTIGSELRAGNINVSLDGGHLTVIGTVDASGAQVGAIRLAASNGLTLAGTAVLDAHGEILRVDSYGKIIDSPNRAVVELSSGQGMLTLGSGARIDLRHGTAAVFGAGAGENDGIARGTLELNAPRLGMVSGDIAIDASGPLDIRGARSIAVNAMQTYTNAPYALVRDDNGNLVLDQNGDPTRDIAAGGRPYQVIDQSWIDDRHSESTAFIAAALSNGALMNGKLAGLNNATYRNAFHLRPGVELVTEGDLVISGDLDLSGHRYDGVNPNFVRSGVEGSGEVGRFNIRAAGNIDVFGSINDGFAPPPETPDDSGWVLLPGKQPFNGDVVVPRAGIELHDGTAFMAGVTLNYDLPIQAMTMASGTRLPVAATLVAPVVIPANTVLSAAIRNADGTIAYAAGTRMAQAVTLDADMILDPGTLLSGATMIGALTWPKGVPLPHQPAETIFDGNPDVVRLAGVVTLAMGALIPAATDVQLAPGVTGINLRGGDGKGRNWALAQMLPEGSQSWSVRLVAGADVTAADNRLTNPRAAEGSIRLADTHYGMQGKLVLPTDGTGPLIFTEEGSLYWFGTEAYIGRTVEELAAEYGMTAEDMCGADAGLCLPRSDTPPGYSYAPTLNRPVFSVLRTGTGDLDLLTAKNLSMQSLYGVYTAGTSSSSRADNAALGFDQARGKSDKGIGGAGFDSFVDGSAGSLYRAWYPDRGGNLLLTVGGDLTGDLLGTNGSVYESNSVGNWLWRQGTGTTVLDTSVPTSWWINFGTYVASKGNTETVGFTGFGTLGGGNIDVQVGGDAGMVSRRGDPGMQYATRSQALILAVGSTGRIVDGSLISTGGGDMTVRIGGGLNPTLDARAAWDGSKRIVMPRLDLTGSLIDLRGAMQISAGLLGGIELLSGQYSVQQDRKETRAYDPFVATAGNATGGLMLVPGDATASLTTRGDLVLGGALDAGRAPSRSTMTFSNGGILNETGGTSWFTLWTDRTAVNLFSAGGNLAPITLASEKNISQDIPVGGLDFSPTDGRYVYPSILRAVAASGSLYYGPSAGTSAGLNVTLSAYSLTLAPGSNAELQFLAANSIYAGGYAVSPSGADPSTIATPFNPAFMYYGSDIYAPPNGNAGNGSVSPAYRPLFAFGGNTAAGFAGADAPVRFYARDGDIVGVRTGEILQFDGYLRRGTTWYEAARPVWIKAGRDIVNSGTQIGLPSSLPTELTSGSDFSSGNLFVHNSESDVSIVSAGRDLIHSSFNIAGPGTLEITAGRHIQMDDKASVTSLGAIVPGDNRPGAGIAMMAGVGAGGLDFSAIRNRYLDPANLLPAGTPLDGSGKVAKTYEKELAAWLQQRFGFAGTKADARASFDALAPEQQRVFLRQVYFAELTAGGREYNDATSSRYGSYLRGRDMIAALFATTDGMGKPSNYLGDITMYGGAGVRSNFGGDIRILNPGGKLVIGVEGLVPPASAGLVTQGAGDIQIYSRGSVLLGLSRIMTTFGGNIFAWSAEGDINAGRGAKTTVIYTPPKRVYDAFGNVTLSPQVPSSGAGIATLNPIPEVPPGDIDLIAPLGTIDAGEAGIRVSGNVNLAALQVLNAANIQVQGTSAGIPTVQAPSISSALSTSNAAAATQQTTAPTQSANTQPSVIIVEVLGYGGGGGSNESDEKQKPAPDRQTYNPAAPVRVVGFGPLKPADTKNLTEEERERALRE